MKTEAEGSRSACERLSGELRSTLAEVLKGTEKVALVDFPEHDNVGDSAIWKGERELLAVLGVEVVYCSTKNSHCVESLKRRLDDSGSILLHGGGNFGDLWPDFQGFRERVVRDFPGHRIVQMPQTLHFAATENLRAARGVFGEHQDITLLVRDETSLELARSLVGARARLCPDSAFSLRLPRSEIHEYDVLWLMRQDKEAAANADGIPAIRGTTRVVADWPEDPYRRPEGPRIRRSIDYRLRRLDRRVSQDPRTGHLSRLNRPGSLDRRAARRLAGGLEFLSRGRVVVTDRLHGHILCLLLGKPHVVLDNSYGKLTGFMAAWGTASESVRVVEDRERAATAAAELLDVTR